MYISYYTSMFTIILCLIIGNLSFTFCDPVVNTPLGKVKGIFGSYQIDGEAKSYEAFLGIPFAEPPLGELRFELPKQVRPWDFEYSATHFRDGCMQNPSPSFNFNISEDCLYLNIWRPHTTEEQVNSKKLVPVYYFLHGSGYVRNSAAMPKNQGDVLAATQGIIVVNSNYRLGAFGFARGSPDKMRGNLGLYDALEALKWIQNNIKAFGGDPNQVTLAGQSAGAKMITIIATLPDLFSEKKLYSRLIMMSGAATSVIHEDPLFIAVDKTRLLSKTVGCGSDESTTKGQVADSTIYCLKNTSNILLLKGQNNNDITALGACEISVFLPTSGSEMMPKKPMVNHIERRNKVENVPMLVGAEQDEASMFTPVNGIKTYQDAYDFMKKRIQFAKKDIDDKTFETILAYYLNNQTDPQLLKERCIEFASDMNYHCPSLILSELFSINDENIFYYRNEHASKKMNRPFGTQHGDDQLFAMGDPFRNYNSYTSSDRQFSTAMLKLFGDFVKGKLPAGWPRIKLNLSNQGSLQGIRILSNKPKNGVDHSQKACLEWAKIFSYQIPEKL